MWLNFELTGGDKIDFMQCTYSIYVRVVQIVVFMKNLIDFRLSTFMETEQ